MSFESIPDPRSQNILLYPDSGDFVFQKKELILLDQSKRGTNECVTENLSDDYRICCEYIIGDV